jgi:hypothetical protein
MHGGSSPQALRKADERMPSLVHPAIDSLARLIAQDDFAAVKYTLDYAGFRATLKVQSESQSETIVTVVFDKQPIDYLSAPARD